MDSIFDSINRQINEIPTSRLFGRVSSIQGLMVEVDGIDNVVSIGGRVYLENNKGIEIPCEVVGFRNGKAQLMSFGKVEGVSLGAKAFVSNEEPAIYPCDAWLGRIVNAFGEAIDDNGLLQMGNKPFPFHASPPPAHLRQRLGGKIDLGVRALNTFLTMTSGQRMGIFAGSGVGKSILMSMLARYTDSDVSVIGLVGERGREVQEFVQDDLGEEGLKKSIVVVATSDQPPLMRRQAAYTTLAIAEYFRSQGKNVLCMMDSVTRFAMAQREIGLSAGEPPTSKGYPPTTFTELAKLLERAGPGKVGEGNITGLFSVLVEGDDHNEPISDAVRGIIDGHIVMDRTIADRGRYPAINILRSVSRSMPRCNTAEETALIRRARELISIYEDMAELIRLGAYRKGSDPKVDNAIRLYDKFETFLNQDMREYSTLEQGYAELEAILNG